MLSYNQGHPHAGGCQLRHPALSLLPKRTSSLADTLNCSRSKRPACLVTAAAQHNLLLLLLLLPVQCVMVSCHQGTWVSPHLAAAAAAPAYPQS
jgi:hypothetical protein